MTKIKLLVVPPGERPRVESVETSWAAWYPLVSPKTDTFAVLQIAPCIDMLFDQEPRDMPLNVFLPARAPQSDTEFTFTVDTTKGEGMKPNEPGIGYHKICGTFLIARRPGSVYVDLTDADIKRYTRALGRS